MTQLNYTENPKWVRHQRKMAYEQWPKIIGKITNYVWECIRKNNKVERDKMDKLKQQALFLLEHWQSMDSQIQNEGKVK